MTASLALHLALIMLVPGLVSSQKPPDVRVLDVVLLKPEAPKVAAVAPEKPMLPGSRKPVRQPELRPKSRASEVPVTARDEHKPETGVPMSGLSEARPGTEPVPGLPFLPASASPGAPNAGTEAMVAPGHVATVTAPLFNAAYLRNPPPRYPLIARRNGEQGTVTLRVLVTRDGLPANVSIEKTSGSGHLDNAALETVRTWRFVPARRGEQPVEAWVLVPIVFRLEGAS